MSFNSYIRDAGPLLIIFMLEIINMLLMQKFQSKRERMMKYEGLIYPGIQWKLEK